MTMRLIAGCLLCVATIGDVFGEEPARITPLVHASLQIEYGEFVIQVDPWSGGDLTRAKKADLILITDDPPHHLDPSAIRELRKAGAPVLVPPASLSKFPEGTPFANGDSKVIGTIIRVEAIPAYDLKPGEPSHPKGKANGYLITLGRDRIYVAGVTECVQEVRTLLGVSVAVVPMNLPLGRMTPEAAAACVNAIEPRVVYVYHYDQEYVSKGEPTPGIEITVKTFRDLLDKSIAFPIANWYPPRPKR